MQPTPPPQTKKRVQQLLRALLLAPVLLVLLFEEWGWEPLGRFFKALARLPFWGALEQRIVNLTPWAALLAFGIPVLALVPIKLLALYLLGNGHAVMGLGLVIGAKITGTALAARLFQLTEPALMQLPWFARLYIPWKIWKDRKLAQVRDSAPWQRLRDFKLRGTATAKRGWLALRAQFSSHTD
jgi:hypothetical protein